MLARARRARRDLSVGMVAAVVGGCVWAVCVLWCVCWVRIAVSALPENVELKVFTDRLIEGRV